MVRPVSPLLRALFLSRAAFPCLAAALVALPARAQVCEPAPTRDAQHLLQAAETDELFAKALMEAAQACRIPGELCDGALQRCRTYANALGAQPAAHDESGVRAELTRDVGGERFDGQLPAAQEEAPAYCAVTNAELAAAQASKRRMRAQSHRQAHAMHGQWSEWAKGAVARCAQPGGSAALAAGTPPASGTTGAVNALPTAGAATPSAFPSTE